MRSRLPGLKVVHVPVYPRAGKQVGKREGIHAWPEC